MNGDRMKIIFLVYHDVIEDRVSKLLDELKIDYFTEWENVKGKGHNSDAHLGSRTFPGYNSVRMIAFQDDQSVNSIIEGVSDVLRKDDKVRLFQLPLEKII